MDSNPFLHVPPVAVEIANSRRPPSGVFHATDSPPSSRADEIADEALRSKGSLALTAVHHDESPEWIIDADSFKRALDEHAITAVIDSQGCIRFANDKLCAISNYSQPELIGYDLLNSQRHSKTLIRDLWATIKLGKVWRGEIQLTAKDGSARWLSTTIVPCFEEPGRSRQFLVAGSDCSHRRRVEIEFAERIRVQKLLSDLTSRFGSVKAEGLDAAIKDGIRLVVIAFDLDRGTLWQIGENGGGADAILSHVRRSRRGAFPASRPPAATDLPWSYGKLMRGEIVSFSSVDELTFDATTDAETFRSQGVKSKVMIPLVANDRPFGALTFTMLRTERKWRENEINDLKVASQIIGNVVGLHRAELREEQLHSELVHTMRVATLGDMVAALAHELNQPLAAILSNAQAARRFIATGEIHPDELREILDDMVRDDKRAGSVIHNLRAMVSKRPAVREACRLNDLISEVIGMLHSELVDTKISVHSTLDPDLPCVEAARVELQQVLLNLFSNAVQAMENTACESRILAVETRVEGPSIVVQLRDLGPGIPPEKLSAIFNPFYSTKTNGLGMGLSICRRIVENHGGRIEARNCSDGGATFLFSLPILASPEE